MTRLMAIIQAPALMQLCSLQLHATPSLPSELLVLFEFSFLLLLSSSARALNHATCAPPHAINSKLQTVYEFEA